MPHFEWTEEQLQCFWNASHVSRVAPWPDSEGVPFGEPCKPDGDIPGTRFVLFPVGGSPDSRGYDPDVRELREFNLGSPYDCVGISDHVSVSTLLGVVNAPQHLV